MLGSLPAGEARHIIRRFPRHLFKKGQFSRPKGNTDAPRDPREIQMSYVLKIFPTSFPLNGFTRRSHATCLICSSQIFHRESPVLLQLASHETVQKDLYEWQFSDGQRTSAFRFLVVAPWPLLELRARARQRLLVCCSASTTSFLAAGCLITYEL